MPTALPVTAVTMNYSSVVLVGFGAIAAIWFLVHSRKGECSVIRLDMLMELTIFEAYKGPPASEGL